jgi:hypothetical protein
VCFCLTEKEVLLPYFANVLGRVPYHDVILVQYGTPFLSNVVSTTCSCYSHVSKCCESPQLRLDRSTALYIYKDKNFKLLAVLTHAQKTKFIFK